MYAWRPWSELRTLAAGIAATALLAATGLPGNAVAQGLKLGAATVATQPKGGDKGPPPAPGRTEAMAKLAAPTNQWYSGLLFENTKPEPIYVQPITVRPTTAGLEFAFPKKAVVPTERRDVEIHYTHADPIVVSPVAFEAGPGKLAKTGDWSIEISMARGSDDMRVGVAHGSPYAQVRLSRGDVRVRLPAAGERVDGGADARVLALKVGDRRYALFGAAGSKWENVSPTEWVGRLPAGAGHVAVAALPDDRAESLALLGKHAMAFIEDTTVAWQYDRAKSVVQTTFTAKTRAMDGGEATPLLGLYPHHWHRNASVDGRLGPAYDTVRGAVKLLAAGSFSTTAPYHGFVPWWPAVGDGPRSGDLKDVMKTDLRNARRMMLEIGNGPYWQGKGIQRITKLLDVVQVQGEADDAAQLRKLVQGRIESWFSGQSSKTYFHLDRTLGTLIGYPEEYFSVQQMNDHHFHYGYWIRTVAELGLRDPAWASREQWGGIVDLMVSDIANTERGSAAFPFLRNFDPYEGHSWASGIGLGPWGNNQESSSEAVNAWTGLILWGELTGNAALRDLGAWLYATEIQSIQHYWFDLHGLVFAPEYKAKSAEVSMLFGGKYAHNTWWTDEPRQIKGINLLPITTASLYMGADPAFVQRSLATLGPEVETYRARGKSYGEVPKDIWQDIFSKYLALADPARALKTWDRWGSFEFGDTRTHTLHWLMSLDTMGTPDLGVTADTPLYSVFRKADGARTYLAFNAGKAPITVRFSDGKRLEVAPGTLAQAR